MSQNGHSVKEITDEFQFSFNSADVLRNNSFSFYHPIAITLYFNENISKNCLSTSVRDLIPSFYL